MYKRQLFIDIDDLKTTNDTLGHMAGDDMLRAAAQRLLRAIGAEGVVGRLGGDEFVVLVFGDASASDITEMVERVREELTAGQSTDATTLPVRASIGVVDVGPDDPRTADEILRHADEAMYEAKRARGNGLS